MKNTFFYLVAKAIPAATLALSFWANVERGWDLFVNAMGHAWG